MNRRRRSGRASPQPGCSRPPGEGAFTLVEVLLALVLLAALLAALNQFVFSITEAWTHHRDEFTFAQHCRAVTLHLQGMLQTASAGTYASNTTAGAPAAGEEPVPDGGTASLLAFDLPLGDRVLTWPARPLPEVHCALAWRRDDGLVLYWKSRLETDFNTGTPRVAVLSPFVTALSYDYYDETNKLWETEAELRENPDGTPQTPRRIRLHFHRGKQDYDETIELPATVEGLPAY
jgi:prepilin-type N-terminal cleavage/methylation domain-containing protein